MWPSFQLNPPCDKLLAVNGKKKKKKAKNMPAGSKRHIFSVTFRGVKRLEACESALIRVVTPKDHRQEVPSRANEVIPWGALIALSLFTTESQGFISLGPNLFDSRERDFWLRCYM